jgi:tetratricopeptide (TPR) repeat protein
MMNSKSRPPQGAPAKGDPAPAAKAAAPGPAKPSPPAQPAQGPVPPLFRRLDWLTMGVTCAIVWVIYFICLAPQVTLEDSGELCTASYYAGIPHPPGYPFWTIYTWLWTVLVPFKNIAWRVALAEASTAAMSCGVLALMVSRGSSMLMEGIEELKNIASKWEGAICVVSGLVAGLMLGLGSSMWKESVVINRISLFGVPWLLVVLVFIMRWNYAPHQRRYLYGAFFFLGICATIHQTLTMAIMGIEIGVTARQPKLGRDMFFLNSVFYLLGLLAKSAHMVGMFDATNPMVFRIFNGVGLCSLAACVYLVIKTNGLLTEWKSTLASFGLMILGGCFYIYEAVSGMTNPPMEWGYPRTVEGFWHALSRGQYDRLNPTDIFKDPGHFMTELSMLFTGLADAYSLVAMFFAVLPLFFIFKMQKRERSWIISIAAIYPFLGVMLSIFLNPTPDRQNADLVKVFFTASHAVVAILIGYGMALTASFMATHYEKFRRWGFAGAGVAIALALYSLYSVTAVNYFGLEGRNEMGLSSLPHWIAQSFAPHQYGSAVIASLMLVGMTLVFLASLFIYNQRAPMGITLALFALMPVYSGMSHWYKSEQHNHWFGYWFGHDMFTPPFVGPDGNLTYDATLREAAAKGRYGKMVYPEMARDAVLFGGTDPGRFCPTYTIFCESFIPHDCQPEQDQHYDRRDVYIITQNALADGTYLDYIRAQYNRYAQIDPPFFQNFLSGSLPGFFHGSSRWLRGLDDIFEGIGASVEKTRRTGTSLFKPDQFLNARSLAAKLRQGGHEDPLAKYLYGKLSQETQHVVDSNADEAALRRALSKDLNVMLAAENIYAPERFKDIKLPPLIQEAAAAGNLTSNNIIRLNRRMLEEAYPDAIVKSLGGVYPDTEILTPTPDDSGRCFNDYYYDAQRRLQHDIDFPNERRQVKPGEDVKTDGAGHLQISGQIAVMSINGLLTKVIFDRNPHHEFYVEESFPLDWMYPYLEPFGIIMKIDRHPIQELSQEVIDKDHVFWSEYSRRTIGNWITYDTTVKQICDWAEDVYLRHDLSHFTGDPKFVHDDDGQKAFSKLRSSIASSIYQWRSEPQNSRSATERPRVTKEAEFAFKQAFAYCPFSPEAVFHFMNLLLNQAPSRVDDAILLLETCHKLDPYSEQISYYIEQLKKSKTVAPPAEQIKQALAQIQQAIARGQTNVAEQILDQLLNFAGADPGTLITVADSYLRLHNTAKSAQAMAHLAQIQQALPPDQSHAAEQILDQLLNSAGADPGLLIVVANGYLRLHNMAKSEQAIVRLTQIQPNVSQPWYNLAAIQSYRSAVPEALTSLKKALDLNAAEIAKDPKMLNLRAYMFQDPTFAQLRQTAAFQAEFGSKP